MRFPKILAFPGKALAKQFITLSYNQNTGPSIHFSETELKHQIALCTEYIWLYITEKNVEMYKYAIFIDKIYDV